MAKKPKYDPSTEQYYTGSLAAPATGGISAGAVTANDIAMQNAPKDPLTGSPIYTREMLVQKQIEDQLRAQAARDIPGDIRNAFNATAGRNPSPYTSHVGENITDIRKAGKVVNGQWIPNEASPFPQGLPDAVRATLPVGASTLPAPAQMPTKITLPPYMRPQAQAPLPPTPVPVPGSPTPQTQTTTTPQPTVPLPGQDQQNAATMQQRTPAAYAVNPSGGNFNGTLKKLGVRLPGYIRR